MVSFSIMIINLIIISHFADKNNILIKNIEFLQKYKKRLPKALSFSEFSSAPPLVRYVLLIIVILITNQKQTIFAVIRN